MIISCEKCNKKFELSDDLVPKEGRVLQCGSCMHKWHFTPPNKTQTIQKIQKNDEPKREIAKETKKVPKGDIKNKAIPNQVNLKNNVKDHKKNKKVGFLSYLLVFIITFIALIVIAETFEPLISSFIPNFDLYLSSLHESLKDIFLFFKDLIK